MFDITRWCQGQNLGGINYFMVIPKTDVQSIPVINRLKMFSQLTLLPGKTWYTIFSTLETASFKEESVDTPHGTYYKWEIRGLVPKDQRGLAEMFWTMDNQEYLVRVLDHNGVWRLLGDLSSGLSLKMTHDTAAQASGRNQREIVLTGESSHPAYYFDVSVSSPSGSGIPVT